jgi:hypothetical protein
MVPRELRGGQDDRRRQFDSARARTMVQMAFLSFVQRSWRAGRILRHAFLRCGEFPASRDVSMSSLGWYLACAAPLLVSSGYVVWVMVFYLIERHRASVQIDLRSRLRDFLSECGADPRAGDEKDVTQLRETLKLLDELRETRTSSSSAATAQLENIA